MKLLVLEGVASAGELEPAAQARRRALVERALGVASEALVGPAGATSAPLAETGAGRSLRLDADRFAGGLAIDGLILDFAPDAVVGLGIFAALAMARLTSPAPGWIDFAEDPVSAPRPPRPWGRESELDYWHELLWALDRADRLSCADERVASSLRAMLAIRGRFPAAAPSAPPAPPADADADAELIVLADPATGGEAFDRWLRHPP
jgi:hypothetical protein